MDTLPTLPPPAIPPPVFQTEKNGSIRDGLLPNSFASPWALFLAIVPSELLLLALNGQSAWLAWGEMNTAQSTHAMCLGATLALFILGAVFRVLLAPERPLGTVETAVVLVLHIAYLWACTVGIDTILPDNVTTWIVDPSRLTFYQFTLATPALGFALLRLASFPAQGFSASRDALYSFGTMFLAVLGTGFFLAISSSLISLGDGELAGWLIALILVVATTLCLGALLRLSTMLFIILQGENASRRLPLILIVGLALPLAGLCLNTVIPFPYNFQSNQVYLLTVLNAAFLLLPVSPKPWIARGIWWLRCMSFPFSAYFLFIFLPFLPLSIFAIIAFGAGFLILTPVALVMLHGNMILEGWQKQRDLRNAFSPTAQLFVAFLVMPGIYFCQCRSDRAALRQALDYVYRPDYLATAQRPVENLKAAQALVHLRDFKAGLGLPFLSEFYSWMLFDNLVLPDEKIASLHQVFTGAPLPEMKQEIMGNLFGNHREQRDWTSATTVPDRTQEISKAEINVQSSGETIRARLDLEVSNSGQTEAEFYSHLTLPPGVVIADYALFIGPDRVPGQLFEKKTALWVYEKIVNVTRRDPGLVVYTGIDEVDLRIFPVPAQGTRRAQLELLYPAGSARSITLGNRTIALPQSDLPGRSLAVRDAASGVSVELAASPERADLAMKRKPVLFLLVDASATNSVNPQEIQQAITGLQRYLPGETRVVVQMVNYDARPWKNFTRLDSSKIENNDLSDIHAGGFWPQLAMRQILLAPPDRGLLAVGEYPLFTVVTKHWDARFKEENFHLEGQICPDLNGFILLDGKNEQFITWADGKATGLSPDFLEPMPITLLAVNGERQAVRADVNGAMVHFFQSTGSNDEIKIYRPDSNTWEPLPDLNWLPPTSDYAAALMQWADEKRMLTEPAQQEALLQKISARSKSTRIMSPSMAYIVVENSAQWKMLAKTEKQKLQNGQELAIEEPQATPEPATWAMLAFGGLAFWLRSRFGKRRVIC